MSYQAPEPDADVTALAPSAPVATFLDRLETIVEVYREATALGEERAGRLVLVAGVRLFALELVAQVVDGPACATHRWTTRLAGTNFRRMSARLEARLTRELQTLQTGTARE